jgi:hypothetical protein
MPCRSDTVVTPDILQPGDVASLTATPSTSGNTLSWVLPVDPDLRAVEIEWSLDGTSWMLLTTLGLVETYLDGDAQSDVETTYRVKTVNTVGTKSDGVTVAATRTTGVTTPATPTSLVAVAGSDGVTLNWDDNAEEGVGYLVYRASSDGGDYQLLTSLPLSVSTYLDSTAPSGVAVYYRVVAIVVSMSDPAEVSATRVALQSLGIVYQGEQAPATVHANAVGLSPSGALPHLVTYEWCWGDDGAYGNIQTAGSTAAHCYQQPGTYTVTCKMTDRSGNVTWAGGTVVVAAAARTRIYCSLEGNDLSSGLSAGQAVKTLARALTLVGNDTELLLRAGDIFQVTRSIPIACKNVVVGKYWTGTNPVINYSGTESPGMIFKTRGAQDLTIRDLQFTSSSATPARGVEAAGQNITVLGCFFGTLGDGVNAELAPSGLLVQQCSTLTSTCVRGYCVYLGGSMVVLQGNSFLGAGLACVRGDPSYTLLYGNTFINATRSNVTLQKGSYGTVAGNTFSGMGLNLGPLGGADGAKQPEARTTYTIVRDNLMTLVDSGGLYRSHLQLCHGLEGCWVFNNILLCNGTFAIILDGYSSSYARGVVDLVIEHTTGVNTSANGGFLRVNGVTEGLVLEHNLYSDAVLAVGGNENAVLFFKSSDLAGLDSSKENSWPVVVKSGVGETFFIAPGWGGYEAAGYARGALWNTYSQVDGDLLQTVVLSAEWEPVDGGVTQGARL